MDYNFPRQSISYKKKTKEWCKECMKFADTHSILSSSSVRKTAAHKKLNYDLLNGDIHMDDLIKVLNPQGFKFERKDMFSKINHYPIINKVINLLVGEEMSSQQDNTRLQCRRSCKSRAFRQIEFKTKRMEQNRG